MQPEKKVPWQNSRVIMFVIFLYKLIWKATWSYKIKSIFYNRFLLVITAIVKQSLSQILNFFSL